MSKDSKLKNSFVIYFVDYLRGTRQKVKTTGQTKADLMKNKRGRIVSKAAHAKGKRIYKKNGINKWTSAFLQARKNLKMTGFTPCKK